MANLRWKIVWIFTVVSVLCAAPLSRADNARQKNVEETRQALRRQGFKTDLADFDFSTSFQLRAREAILKATALDRRSRPLNLMEAVETDSAVVVWKLNSLKKQFRYRSWPDYSDELTWEEFRKAVNANQPQIDGACASILSGPIRFNLNASRGRAMLLPHLAMLRNLTETFGKRTVLDLHDGNMDAAWTNLMAATRLVTAWEPEPVEISHMVRFTDTSFAFNAIWQALQTNGWTDEQLARLQTEWESVDFFTHLPETAAFMRAGDVALCQQERQGLLNPRPTLIEFVEAGLQFPVLIWSELNKRWSQANYSKRGSYEDEKALLLFYRDRELELRNAVQAPTWSAMRQLPNVVYAPPFHSKYPSHMHPLMNLREIQVRYQQRFQNEGATLLGRAALAEAQRRLIIAAIALERHRGKHGSYPNTLSELAPEFLKNPPADFMDGRPLRYRPADDGHFILYSIGLDCVDHGGQMPSRQRPKQAGFEPDSFGTPSKGDIVWPLPASTAAVGVNELLDIKGIRGFLDGTARNLSHIRLSATRGQKVQYQGMMIAQPSTRNGIFEIAGPGNRNLTGAQILLIYGAGYSVHERINANTQEIKSMPIQVGSKAPDFTLKSKNDSGLVDVKLSANFGRKNTVLLFFPAAFTSVCTSELCDITAGLGQYAGLNAAVIGISVDTPFAQEAWAKKERIGITLASDLNKTVTRAYDVLFPNLAGIGDTAARAAFVIDKQGVVQYAEQTPSPKDLPDFAAVRAALSKLA